MARRTSRLITRAVILCNTEPPQPTPMDGMARKKEWGTGFGLSGGLRVRIAKGKRLGASQTEIDEGRFKFLLTSNSVGLA